MLWTWRSIAAVIQNYWDSGKSAHVRSGVPSSHLSFQRVQKFSPILDLVNLIHRYGKGGLGKYWDIGGHRPHLSDCAIDLLCSSIGLCFCSHSHPVEAFHSQQDLHLCFPFKKVEGSEDSFLWIHSFRKSVPAVSRRIPVLMSNLQNNFWRRVTTYNGFDTM